MEIYIALAHKCEAFKSEQNCLRTHIVKDNNLHDLS